MTLVTFSFPEMTLFRNSVDSAFLFWLYSPERKRRICGNFLFINQFQRFFETERPVTILILETQNGYYLDVFLPKEDNFQGSCINQYGCLKKLIFCRILGYFSTINNFMINFVVNKVGLETFFLPELTFFRNSANSAFSSLQPKTKLQNRLKVLVYCSLTKIFTRCLSLTAII